MKMEVMHREQGDLQVQNQMNQELDEVQQLVDGEQKVRDNT